MKFIEPTSIPGLAPWECEFDGPDGKYGITLYGSDPAQVVRENRDRLPGLKVIGEHMGIVKIEDEDNE